MYWTSSRRPNPGPSSPPTQKPRASAGAFFSSAKLTSHQSPARLIIRHRLEIRTSFRHHLAGSCENLLLLHPHWLGFDVSALDGWDLAAVVPRAHGRFFAGAWPRPRRLNFFMRCTRSVSISNHFLIRMTSVTLAGQRARRRAPICVRTRHLLRGGAAASSFAVGGIQVTLQGASAALAVFCHFIFGRLMASPAARSASSANWRGVAISSAPAEACGGLWASVASNWRHHGPGRARSAA